MGNEMCKEVGTLAEIGVQVGDVVEVTQWLGITFSKGDTGVVVYGSHHSEGSFGIDASTGKFRIVTRAEPQGPVVEETVKRIVPGVYGKVSVEGKWGESVWVALVKGNIDAAITVPDIIGHVRLNRDDLIAARDVFKQLIDAMSDQND